MIDYNKIVGYRKGLRPVQPDSLPVFVDRELERISIVTGSIVEALRDLEARIAALEP